MLKRNAVRITSTYRRSSLRASVTYHYQSAMASRSKTEVERYFDNAEAMLSHFLQLR